MGHQFGIGLIKGCLVHLFLLRLDVILRKLDLMGFLKDILCDLRVSHLFFLRLKFLRKGLLYVRHINIVPSFSEQIVEFDLTLFNLILNSLLVSGES